MPQLTRVLVSIDSASQAQRGIRFAQVRGQWVLAELEKRRHNKHIEGLEAQADFEQRSPLAAVPVLAQTAGQGELRSKGKPLHTFYEFFAGGGMARAGLGEGWHCAFANEIDAKKAASYIANWGGKALRVCDVAKLTTPDLDRRADLAWASFPCQDLSLAGAGAGLQGKRSGTFWPFWQLMTGLVQEGRAPRLIVLENVYGALTSHGGGDFAAIGKALAETGYRLGAVILDAVHFLPQSRPRLFVVAAFKDLPLPTGILAATADQQWHPPALIEAYGKLPASAKEAWLWWRLPTPPIRNTAFVDLIEDKPEGVRWHTDAETEKLLRMMSGINRNKVDEARRSGRRLVGGIYKRTRIDEASRKVQRAEIRFDDVAGCLRTPRGGSSRQTIMIVEGETVRSRLLSPREAARLMGLPDAYRLPTNYNEAYHLAGDGVAVPAVRYLAEHILEPLLALAAVDVPAAEFDLVAG
jgi:DNA (cytosine-5)-methyltransferase 1